MRSVEKAIGLLTERGLAACARRTIDVIWRSIFPYAHMVYAADPSCETSASAALPSGFTVSRYTRREDVPPRDVEAMGRVRGGREFADEFVSRFLSEGANLWLARWDGELAGYRLTAQGPEIASAHFPFIPMAVNDGLLFSGETLAGHRGKGVSPMMTDYMSGQLLAEGATRLYVTCGEWNIANRRSLAKTRFVLLGVARAFRVFGHRVVIWRKNRPPVTVLR